MMKNMLVYSWVLQKCFKQHYALYRLNSLFSKEFQHSSELLQSLAGDLSLSSLKESSTCLSPLKLW